MDMLHDKGSYDCFVQQTQQQDFTECTILLRRKNTSDQIIQKQAILLQKVKHDNQLLKRFLERKTVEMGKMKLCIQTLESDNQQLRNQIDSVSKVRGGEHNHQLNHENEQLRQRIAQLQAEQSKIDMQQQSEILRLQQEIQNLSNENQFLQKMNKQNEYLQKVELRCRELQLQLQRERRNNQPQKRGIEFIKIDGQPEYQETDQVKNSLDFADPNPKRTTNQCEISAVRSRNSDRNFQDCQASQESQGEKGKSVSYQKSEAQIQTERCEIYGSGMLSREKIERSIRRDNHHMKPMDEYTRIMNLSKELNQKEQTIKELQKRVEREKKNSESVKSKLKEREKQLKQIKKNKSLKREILIEDEPVRVERKEEERKDRDGMRSEEAKEIVEERIEEVVRDPEEEVRVEGRNVVIIQEAREMNEVNVQTEPREEERIRQEIEVLRAENQALKAARGEGKQEEEYVEQGLRISIAEQHDSESEGEDETAVLKAEITTLRAKVKELEELREEIPFEEVQQEKQLNQVVVQTQEKPASQMQSQPNDLMNYLLGFNDVKVVIDGGAEQQYNVFIEEKQFAEVNIQTQHHQKTEHQEQRSNDAEAEPVIQMLELKPVHVHQMPHKNQSEGKQVLIGRRDRYHQREEERQQKQKLEEQLQSIKEEIELLKAQNLALKAAGKVEAKLEEEYAEENLRISVTAKYDSQSQEQAGEVTVLKAEVHTLKAKIKDLEEMQEEIPFEEVQETKELKEVVIQTQAQHKQPDASDYFMQYIQGMNLQNQPQPVPNNPLQSDPQQLVVTEILEEIYGKVVAEASLSPLQQPPHQLITDHPTIHHQTQLNSQLQFLKKTNEFLLTENSNLKIQLQSKQQKRERQQEEYLQDNLRISITAQHDSQSQEQIDQTAILRAEVLTLKAKLQQFQEQRQGIPFEEVEEEKEMREVILQTQIREDGCEASDTLMEYISGLNLQGKVQGEKSERIDVRMVNESVEEMYGKVAERVSSQQSAEKEEGGDQHDGEVRRLREENKVLQGQIARMKELLEQQERQEKGKEKNEEEYVEEGLRISIAEQHDSESEGEDETVILKAELNTLKAKVKELEEQREQIPFEEVQEVKTLKEIQMQTEDKANIQEQQIVSEIVEAKEEEEPVFQMKELKRVQVHPIPKHHDSTDQLVFIGRRDRHRQREEQRKEEASHQSAIMREQERSQTLQEQLEDIKKEIESLRAQNLALKAATVKTEAKQEEEYEEENLRISVTAKYDSQSQQEADEVTVLKAEVQSLRAKIKDLQEMREEIPFQEIESTKELKEVVIQTQQKQPDASDHFMHYIQGLNLQSQPQKQYEQQQQQLLLLDDPQPQDYSFIPQPLIIPKMAKFSIQQHIQVHIPRQAETSSVLIPSSASQEKTVHSYIQQPVSHQVKNLNDSSQTPKFQASSRSLYNSSENLRFLEAINRPKDHSDGYNEQLALKNEQIYALNEKLSWLQQKISKYKRLIGKYRQKSEQIFEQIQVQQQQLLLIEVQTQTNPLFINDLKDSLQRRCEMIQSRLQEEQRVNFGLRSKLKRWQNVMKKINYNNISEQSIEDLEELEIQEENVQLCEVEVQVNLASLQDFAKGQDLGMREEIKQTSRIFLNKIENLKQKWIGQDSEENSSEGCSDRGKNTKRSVGSEEQQRLRRQKLLEMEISHLYKDMRHLFKKHHYNTEEITVDNFKEELQAFIQFIKQPARYNSFEEIKEQSNDDSATSKNAGIAKVESQPLLADLDGSNKCIKKESQSNRVDIGLKILYIEHESVMTKPRPVIELNPLVIKEVAYYSLNGSAQTREG